MKNNLEKVRKEKNISVYEACRVAKIKYTQYWYSLEKDKNVPSVELALRIAKAVDSKVEDIWEL